MGEVEKKVESGSVGSTTKGRFQNDEVSTNSVPSVDTDILGSFENEGVAVEIVGVTDDNVEASSTSGLNGAFTIKEIMVPSGSKNASGDIDRAAIAQNAIESDRDYRKITNIIIEKTSEQLEAHTKAKKPLRLILMWFVIGLLLLQFIALIAILFTNQVWSLKISDGVINVYIVSLFVETLAGLIIMIQFAFDSTQEVKLIEILNNIVEHFKKYDEK